MVTNKAANNIVSNRLGREKTNGFQLRSEHNIYRLYLMKGSMLLTYVHILYFEQVLVFSAVSVRERFQEDLMGKAHRVNSKLV